MKKFVFLILSCLMISALSACGQSEHNVLDEHPFTVPQEFILGTRHKSGECNNRACFII